MFVTSYVFIFLNVSYISNSISLETLPPKSNFIQTEITHVVSRNIVDLYEWRNIVYLDYHLRLQHLKEIHS